MMALIGDGMLVSPTTAVVDTLTDANDLRDQIYRCLAVFFYNYWVIVVPVALWVGNAVCAVAIIYISATLRSDTLITADRLSSFIKSFLVITLATNLLTTGKRHKILSSLLI